jgi:hypothetical protein
MSEESGPMIAAWLRYGSYLLAILSVLLDFIGNLYAAETLAEAEGMTFVSVIGVFIALGCAFKCASWAHRLGKSVNFAYGLGFFSGLLGLFGYWIYYNVKKV